MDAAIARPLGLACWWPHGRRCSIHRVVRDRLGHRGIVKLVAAGTAVTRCWMHGRRNTQAAHTRSGTFPPEPLSLHRRVAGVFICRLHGSV